MLKMTMLLPSREIAQEISRFYMETFGVEIKPTRKFVLVGKGMIELENKTLNDVIQRHFEFIKARKNCPVSWMANYGASYEDALIYSESPNGYRVCLNCGVIYKSENNRSGCCSEKCRAERKTHTFVPEYRAKKNGIPIQQAIDEVNAIMAKKDSKSSKYFESKGFSPEEAKKLSSETQAKRSKRTIEYFTSRGCSYEEAVEERAKYQKDKADIRSAKYTKEELRIMNPWSDEFWMNKGYSLAEAKEIKSGFFKKGADAYLSLPRGVRLSNNHLHYSYWKKRFPDSWEEKYADHMKEIYHKSGRGVSSIAKEFCYSLHGKFDFCSNVYYYPDEFGKLIKESKKYVFYDYVDTRRMVCVEFNGNWWHANPETYSPDDILMGKTASEIWKRDAIKLQTIEDFGFRTFVVWEKDYKKNKEEVIQTIYEEIILHENSKN